MAGLGIIPAFVYVGGALVASGLIGRWFRGEISLAETIYGVPQPTVRPPGPAAPQTREEMTTWTPEQMMGESAELYEQWKAGAIPSPIKTDNTWLYVLGIGAVAALVVLRR